jgi:hypothetical protein
VVLNTRIVLCYFAVMLVALRLTLLLGKTMPSLLGEQHLKRSTLSSAWEKLALEFADSSEILSKKVNAGTTPAY